MTIDSRLVKAYTQFSLKLFLEIVKQSAGKNIFVSPCSLAISLAMTYNGASRQTQEAIAQTLELPKMSLEEVNQANASLRETLENNDYNVQVYIANSLWVKEGVSFNPEFLRINKKFYQAKVTDLNFNEPNTPSIINDWVKENTNQKIDIIIDQIDPNSMMFLINATYFKGYWSNPFPKAATEEHPFILLNGTQKQHPMMFSSGNYRYLENEIFQAVNLPYGKGKFSMYIFLPNNGVGLNRFYETLSAGNWEKWMNQFDLKQGFLGLPRFKLQYNIELNDVLKTLGMAIAFDSRSANFSGICSIPPNICIDKIKHKTFVEVNEEGTEASAASSVEMVTKGFQSEPPETLFNMIVDRPFFCTIQYNQTKTILFMGSILEPI
ncbi:serpin family protein [Dapis sp. BLCC M126]|uniref:serpin family protein n=1 Tax=Dapis sp. BLCC M126 TaxID=3400189 RepID=UPI003CEFF001